MLGIVLYEMLVGQPPFRGDSVVTVAHAILKDEPPALGGSPGVVGLDRIVHRALQKSPEERYQTADIFAQDLRSTLLGTDTADVTRIRPMSRLVVLPFRMLRPDPADRISRLQPGGCDQLRRSRGSRRSSYDRPPRRHDFRPTLPTSGRSPRRWTSTLCCWGRSSAAATRYG